MSRAKHDSDAALERVVFDFDGTLADSAQWMRGVIDQMAIKHHFRRVEEHEIEVLRGRTTREILEHLGIDTWRLPFIARDVRRLSADAAGEIGLFAGVTELLEQLARDRIRIAVLTSNGERAVRAVLGKHAELVRHYVCGASLFGKAPKLAKLVRSLDVAAAKVLCVGGRNARHRSGAEGRAPRGGGDLGLCQRDDSARREPRLSGRYSCPAPRALRTTAPARSDTGLGSMSSSK